MTETSQLYVICERLRRATVSMDVVTVVDALLVRLRPEMLTEPESVQGTAPCPECAKRRALQAAKKKTQRAKGKRQKAPHSSPVRPPAALGDRAGTSLQAEVK
jgi:hypothetical protein